MHKKIIAGIDIQTNRRNLADKVKYVEEFENWKTTGPIAHKYNPDNQVTPLEKLFADNDLEKGILLSFGVKAEIEKVKADIQKVPQNTENSHINSTINIYGYVQGRVFRATVQGIAKELGIEVISVDNDQEDKNKVILSVSGEANLINYLIETLKTPHIVAHSRKGEGQFDFGDQIYIMAYSEKEQVKALTPGFQFINMATNSTIISENTSAHPGH